MGTITILPETTKNPITLMGQRAGVCWGGNVEDPEKNYKRGMDCIISGHGRVMEYVNVEMIIAGYSARVEREWYTHIGGSPTRLQSSTRYINYAGRGFDYIIPPSIQNNKEAFLASHIYQNAVAMCILQLGELTKQLTPEFTAAHRQIPWSLIAKTRDNYAHHYGVVDFELVWETAVEDIPGLAAFCSSYLNQ